LRWRCENEGFNVLKNGGFALEHVYSRNPTASKTYFLLMLIAHIFQQLLTRGRLGTVFKSAFNTFRTYGKQMLEALKNQFLPPDLDPPGQSASALPEFSGCPRPRAKPSQTKCPVCQRTHPACGVTPLPSSRPADNPAPVF
jgi:hypothetical protein